PHPPLRGQARSPTLHRRLHDAFRRFGSLALPRARPPAPSPRRRRLHHRHARRANGAGATRGSAAEGGGAEGETEGQGGLLPLSDAREEEGACRGA
ncbi:hypothetical protein LTR16_010752, partial [Cryomyces antarcticus]